MSNIREQVNWVYETNETKIQATIAEFEKLTKFGPNKILDIADKVGVSAGFANHIAELVKADRKANQVTIKSANEARIDRILRTNDGKARKFC